MPIYAYRCAACGHTKDVLQKLSDAPLTQCPACAAPAFAKQVTAAGFQLKGSGWYATDFKGGGAKPTGEGAKPAGEGGKTADAGAATATAGSSDSASAASGGSASAGCAGPCACH